MLAIITVAVLSRLVTFGNPVVIADDQFYLLVGDAMRHGQWPYIDIWDRKPFGLFALFEVIAAIGNGSILAMQLIATAFAAATALVIRQLSLYLTTARGALAAAIAYLLLLALLGGNSGQSPVFYNLTTALAGWALLSAVGRDARAIQVRALAAMLLCGLSMAVKPVALVEGLFFGIAFVILLRRAGQRTAALAASAAAMVALALLPTLIPYALYAARGGAAVHEYIFANYVSIFRKSSLGVGARQAGLGYFFLYAAPLILVAAQGLRLRRGEIGRNMQLRLTIAWLVAAIGGWLLVPNFFDHYALPMLVPLAMLGGLGFGLADGWLYLAAFAVCALLDGRLIDWQANRRASEDYRTVAQVVVAAGHGGCLFVADGPSWLYHDAPPCGFTRYLFPGHLTAYAEADALGVDQGTELARVLAKAPAVIVARDDITAAANPRIKALLDDTLARHYRRLLTMPSPVRSELHQVAVWQRRDLPPPGPATLR